MENNQLNDFDTFRKKILKVNEHRRHKLKSQKNRDIIRKIRKENKDLLASEQTYCKVIRRIHQLLCDELIQSGSIKLPHKLGGFIIESKKGEITIEDGKLKRTMAINWNKTLQLWNEDEKARQKKIILRHKEGSIYKIKYVRVFKGYKNQHVYKFFTNRYLKNKLKEAIKNTGVISYEHRVYNNT